MFCIDIMDDSEDSEDNESNSDSDKIPMGSRGQRRRMEAPRCQTGGVRSVRCRSFTHFISISMFCSISFFYEFLCCVPFHFFKSSFVVFHFIFL